MASGSSNKVERAHQMYRDGRYQEALLFYTDALSAAKTKTQKIALHSNRAACYLKLHDFKKAAEECTSVLQLDHKHTGALMLRAQTLVTLKEYHSALFDVNRLMELNPSSEVYQNLEARLRTQLSLPAIPESEAELDEEEGEEEDNHRPRRKEEDQKDYKMESSVTYQVKSKTHDSTVSFKEDEKYELNPKFDTAEVSAPETQKIMESSEPGRKHRPEPRTTWPTENVAPHDLNKKGQSEQQSKGWQAIPKPKGHSTLDYARWDRVENDSSEDDDEDSDEEKESQPQYRFRVRTVGVRPVK